MDIKDFLLALLADWVSLMSGIASLSLAIVAFVRKWNAVPRRLFIVAAVVCFLLACARVWTTERRRAEKLQQVVNDEVYPRFSCEINQVGEVAKEAVVPGNSVLLLIATLKNTGAPSVAGSYAIKVKLLDGTEVTGLLLTIPAQLPVVYPNGFRRTVKSSQALYKKTVTPVGHNDVRVGFLLFQFMGLSSERLSAAAKSYDLSLRDIYGKPTSCSMKPDQSGPGTTLSFPGLEDDN